MQRPRLLLRMLLPPIAIFLAISASCAWAKKDLFGNDPGAQQQHHVEQLAPTHNHSSSAAASKKTDINAAPVDADAPSMREKQTETESLATSEPTYFQHQLSRFKGQLYAAKEDLFGDKKSPKKSPVPQPRESANSNDARSDEDLQPQVVTISAAEAAQRAQGLAEGQVINVRKYEEENQPRYAVKLLQKNGRMKTINLNAETGALIEETPQ